MKAICTARRSVLFGSAVLFLAAGPALAADVPGSASTGAKLPVTTLSTSFVTGQFEAIGDSDWYKVALTEGNDYAFAANEKTSSFGQLQFRLRSAGGKVLASQFDDPEGGTNGFEFRAKRTGRHYLEVKQVGEFLEPFGYEIKAATDCREDNTTRCRLELGEARKSLLAWSLDEDRFKVQLTSGKKYNITLNDLPDIGGYSLRLFDSAGTLMAEPPPFAPPVIENYGPPVSGSYFVSVLGGDDEVRAALYEVKVTMP